MDDKDQHTNREGEIRRLMISLSTKFEYLAEPDLKEVLREYYNTNKTTMSIDEWEELANGLRDAIGIGHSDLIDEYNDLTQPIS